MPTCYYFNLLSPFPPSLHPSFYTSHYLLSQPNSNFHETMKLLGWMHRKFSQLSGDAPGEFAAAGPTCNCLPAWPSPDDRRHRLMSPATESCMQWMLEDPVNSPPILFEGLLAIGTFGSPIMMASAEPAVKEKQIRDLELEEIAEKETDEATEKDLMVVRAELQKVLAAEADKEKGSGGRISSVSAGAGTKGDMECPLQEFLLSLPVEMGSTALVAPESRHEHRASLGELFMRSRADEEFLPCDKVEKITTAGRNVMMKKMLNSRRAARGKATCIAGEKCDAVAESNKFHKILRIFHRKIYPEAATESKIYAKASEDEDNGNAMATPMKTNKRQGVKQEDDGNTIATPHKTSKRQGASLGWNKSKNREHWIKTDADCK